LIIFDGFFFSSRRRHTRFSRDWSSDVCSSDLDALRRLTKAEIDAKERGHHGKNVEDHADDFDPARTVTADELCCDCQGGNILLEIGRASCRERVWIVLVADTLK